MKREPLIAYFSMEIALEAGIPTYSGGLGVLAGDTLRSAADLGLWLVAVTLIHRKGYFQQQLDANGRQTESPETWRPLDHMEPLDARVELALDGRKVAVSVWRYRLHGQLGDTIPVYLLDTDLPENAPEDRSLTDYLYGGDEPLRLRQEAVLGLGGVAMLKALGHGTADRYHMNEGHAALAVLSLYESEMAAQDEPYPARAMDAVRERCVFTTHTPVPAGHDRFPLDLVELTLGKERRASLRQLGMADELNLTELALANSHFVNGVAMRHGEVSRGMFPHYPIRSITNGVHPATWTCEPMQAVFDRYVPDWRTDPLALRYAGAIPADEIAEAHAEAKRVLVETVRRETEVELDPEVLTIGFARRATAYKRSTLVFRDIDRLAAIAERGGLQLVLAGKAHPRDAEGKALIESIFAATARLRGRVRIAYLPGYDMRLGAALCAGADVWLNNPIPPLEASGTSGMKAALNGVPSLSVLDGWWIEGCVEGVTGWAIGGDDWHLHGKPAQDLDAKHARELYDKLERVVVPCFYDTPHDWRVVMRNAIALNGSFFNTHRMLLEYLYEAYRDRLPMQDGLPRIAPRE